MSSTEEPKKTIEQELGREVLTKGGVVKIGKLAPLVYHDNRKSGSYNVGQNRIKRDKRAAAEKLWAEGKRQQKAKMKKSKKNRDRDNRCPKRSWIS